jgi:hypothetical protein
MVVLGTHAVGFDPYYVPSLVRFVDAQTRGSHGWIEWMGLITAAAVTTSAVQWRFRRVGSALAAPLLVVIALSYALVGAGA